MKRSIANMVKLVSRTAAFFLLLQVVFQVHAEEFGSKLMSTTPMQKMQISVNSRNSSSLTTGNILWDGIIKDCLKKPSMSCFQKNVYSYLDNLLETTNLNFTNRLLFMKNQVDYREDAVEDNEIPESRSSGESDVFFSFLLPLTSWMVTLFSISSKSNIFIMFVTALNLFVTTLRDRYFITLLIYG